MSQYQYDRRADQAGESCEAETVDAREYLGQARLGAFTTSRSLSRSIRHKGEEDRQALRIVLAALDDYVSLDALTRAVDTVKAHLEAGGENPK